MSGNKLVALLNPRFDAFSQRNKKVARLGTFDQLFECYAPEKEHKFEKWTEYLTETHDLERLQDLRDLQESSMSCFDSNAMLKTVITKYR